MAGCVYRTAEREKWMVESEEDVADKLHGVERICEVLYILRVD